MKITGKCSIPVSKPALIGKEREYVFDCIESTWISSNGKYIELFENSFAEYLGVKHALACSNGTVALHLALLALGIGPGDEVIVPTLTYIATANAVKYTGATPVFADSEPDTWNIDPEKLEPVITSKTKAVIPVPLYGHPCNMDPIMDLAKRYDLYVVEDSAEAIGAKYKGKMCGSMADISTFSFYGNKTLTTGEGGMVVTNDDTLAENVRLLKGQGMDQKRRYWFPVLGYNYRMTNIQAAIGLAQLENVDKFIVKRREIARWYNENLKGIPGITLPVEKDYAVHSYWMYSMLIKEEYGKSRDEVMDCLSRKGVETRPFFYPIHVMPVYEDSNAKHLAIASKVATKGINLPTYYELTSEDVRLICDCIRYQGRQLYSLNKTKVSKLSDLKQLKERLNKVRDLEATDRDHVEEMYRRPSHRERKRALVELMANYVKSKDFLDIGCAEGIYCNEAYKFNASSVKGIDISAKKIAKARYLYPELEFAVMDSDRLQEFFDKTFDFILCTEVLQHLLDYKRTIGEAVFLLRSSGYLLISVPNLSKTNDHIFADIDNGMTEEALLKEVGGAGYGRQNAVWKFNTAKLEKELVSEFPLELVEKVPIDTPDGEIKNLWTVLLFKKLI